MSVENARILPFVTLVFWWTFFERLLFDLKNCTFFYFYSTHLINVLLVIMDNVRSSEWFIFMLMMIHVILAIFTKVEESFNVQAIHDLTFHGLDISKVLLILFL